MSTVRYLFLLIPLLVSCPAGAQIYVLEGATFHPELCANLRIPVMMDWPGGVTDSTDNGVLADASMVMDRAVQYHYKGQPAALIQWQDPQWDTVLKVFKIGVSIVGNGNIRLTLERPPDGPSGTFAEVFLVPSEDVTGVEQLITIEPKGPFPEYPPTFGIRVQATDGGMCSPRPFVDYFFALAG